MNTVCNGLYILSTFMFEIYDFAFVFCVFYYFLFKMGGGGGVVLFSFDERHDCFFVIFVCYY